MAESVDTKDASGAGPRGQDDISRSVLDHLLEGCQVVGFDYRYLYVNDAVGRHGRADRDSLVGRTMMEVYPGIETTEMFSILRRCMDERVPAQMENEFTFSGGSKGWFDLRFEPVPEGVTILSVDINDRKQAEVALQHTMRALTTLSQCNQTLVRAVDEEPFLDDVCNIIVQAAGYQLAWIGMLEPGDGPRLRMAAHAGVHPGNCALLDLSLEHSGSSWTPPHEAIESGEAVVARVVATEQVASSWQEEAAACGVAACISLPIRTKGARIGALTIHSPDPGAFDDDERGLLEEVALDLGYGISTLRGHIAQEKTAAELDETRTRTRAIYDHLPHAAFVWRHRAGDFVLADFNEAARVATEGAVAELLGKPSRDIGARIPSLDVDLARCFEERESSRREVDCTVPGAKEARRLVLTYGWVPPDTVLLHTQDITEQRQAEQQLAAAQRLEAVGRLAGGVAHDFNNLLSVILTYAGFAVEQLHESDPVRADIEEVREAGQRAAALTRQLLAFSRKQVLEPQALSLNEVLGGIENMLRRLLGEDIYVEIHRATDLGSVLADPGQLEQVVMNLVVNARDAMPEGGKLTIETANVDLDEEYAEHHIAVRPGPHVMLSVTDTGSGMDAETRSRVFEPFFTTKEQGRGTGLGLSTVYGIVKQSGGNIWLYSEPSRGTSFKVYLPRVDAPTTDLEGRRPTGTAAGSETILLVEDEDAVRRAAERILRTAGYRVLTAANGGEALLLCERHEGQIDLLLTDVVMPVMSGHELARRLKELVPGLKIVLTSGYSDHVIAHQGLADAGTAFIGKPFSAADLTHKVRQALDET